MKPLNQWHAFIITSNTLSEADPQGRLRLASLRSGLADNSLVAQALADGTGSDVSEVHTALLHVWGQLFAAGLIETNEAPEHNIG